MEMGCVVDAMGRIVRALEGAARPAVLWSGGKDSTALLHMVRRVRPDIECIQWRLPWMKRKWEFHDMLAREWNLTVHDQLPAWAGLCHGNGRIDVMEGYAIGSDVMVVARGTELVDGGGVMDDGDWVCGLDWLTRPKAANTDFPWDVLLCGHKNGDVDPCSGPVPLQLDVLRAAGCAAVHYPLRNWSDEDVTDYTLAEGVPWDRNRYFLDGTDGTNGVLRTLADKRNNSDYYQACMRCIDSREGAFVECPKNRLVVDNISSRCAVYEPRHEYCNLRTEQGVQG